MMLLNKENTVFVTYAFYSAIMLIKVVFMGLLVTKRRIEKSVYANPEDCTTYVPDKPDHKPQYNDADVEKARRMHANDLENIVVFVLLGLLFVLIGPNPFFAGWHFRLYAASRMAHTFFYMKEKAFPRFVAHLTGIAIVFSMGLQIVCTTFW